MKFNRFFTKRVYPAEAPPSSLLRQFARELDQRLTDMEIAIINGPDVIPYEFQLEMDRQDQLMKERLPGPTLHLLQTDRGPLYTITPFSEIERGSFTSNVR